MSKCRVVDSVIACPVKRLPSSPRTHHPRMYPRAAVGAARSTAHLGGDGDPRASCRRAWSASSSRRRLIENYDRLRAVHGRRVLTKTVSREGATRTQRQSIGLTHRRERLDLMPPFELHRVTADGRSGRLRRPAEEQAVTMRNRTAARRRGRCEHGTPRPLLAAPIPMNA